MSRKDADGPSAYISMSLLTKALSPSPCSSAQSAIGSSTFQLVVTVGTCSDLKERWDPDATTKAHEHAIQYPNGHVVLRLMHPDGRYEPGGPRVAMELAA